MQTPSEVHKHTPPMPHGATSTAKRSKWDCDTCEDWRTVVNDDGTIVTPCPTCQPDAYEAWRVGTAADREEPAYWLRQRNGAPGGPHLNATEAAMIAARSGTTGDYLSPVGLSWAEPDPTGPGGFSYYTLTPIYTEPKAPAP